MELFADDSPQWICPKKIFKLNYQAIRIKATFFSMNINFFIELLCLTGSCLRKHGAKTGEELKAEGK
tara:strand:- start:1013 stop:1213 length:201 start_codon:yes stop_codon:yes gene_type:complete